MILVKLKDKWYRTSNDRRNENRLNHLSERMHTILQFADVMLSTTAPSGKQILKDRTVTFKYDGVALLQLQLFVQGKTFEDMPEIAYGQDTVKLRKWLDRIKRGYIKDDNQKIVN